MLLVYVQLYCLKHKLKGSFLSHPHVNWNPKLYSEKVPVSLIQLSLLQFWRRILETYNVQFNLWRASFCHYGFINTQYTVNLLYVTLRHFVILGVTQYIFPYYYMLLSNAQISLKMQLLAFLMAIFLYLKYSIGNMPISLCPEWGW